MDYHYAHRHSKGVRDTYAQSGNNNSPAILSFAANGTFRPIRDQTGVVNRTRTREKRAAKLGLPNPFDEFGFANITSTGLGMEYITAANRPNSIIHVYNLDENLTKVQGPRVARSINGDESRPQA